LLFEKVLQTKKEAKLCYRIMNRPWEICGRPFLNKWRMISQTRKKLKKRSRKNVISFNKLSKKSLIV